MRNIKPTHFLKILFLSFLFIPFSNLYSQSKLIGVVTKNDVSSIFVIGTDGSEYLEINPCEPNNCGGSLSVIGFNLDHEILGTTNSGGDNDFGIYFRASLDGSEVAIINHFGEEEDSSRFTKVVKSVEGELFSYPPALVGDVIYKLKNDGEIDHVFFQKEYKGILNLLDGGDGFIYLSGFSFIYKVDKLTSSYYRFTPLVGQDCNTFTSSTILKDYVYGFVFGTAHQGNGSSVDFVNTFKMKTDGTDYQEMESSAGFHLQYRFLSDHQNEKMFLVFENQIILSNLDLMDREVVKTFDNELEGIGLQGVIIGEDQMIYGATKLGGMFGYGTLFKMNKDGSGLSILKHFEKTHSRLLEWKEDVSVVLSPDEVNNVTIYPNPTSEKLFIEYPNPKNETVEIFIFDEIGKQVLLKTNNNGKAEVSISKFPVGIYFLKVIHPSNNNLNFLGKFIKR
jgi:hypothetical protein